ncbi:MAG: S1 RNA-binding domain-containing protein [Eubacteriales bacterium]
MRNFTNVYYPEGIFIATPENREYIITEEGLCRALALGKILEATAVRASQDMTLTVELGSMTGYIPREEAALVPEGEEVRDIAVITRVGKAVCFKVTGFFTDRDGRRAAMLSRRAAQRECSEAYLSSLERGDIIDARVTHLEHFGAFCDVGCGIVSLLSIDCISVSRIAHPRDRFTVGQYIKCAVREIEQESGRIYLTHRELLGTWEENAANFSVGMTVAGVVRSVEEYGIFVELTPNLAGLAEYRADVAAGQTAAVYIKNIIPEKMKIKLVLIDSGRGEPRSPELRYYMPPQPHIDRWRYSPQSASKVIETVF